MIIVITLPQFVEGEAERIVQLLSHRADLVHLRKPTATADELERLIRDIPQEYYGRLVLHDHHHLAEKYHLHGIHLNSRNPLPLKGWSSSVSRSCHSFEEVMIWKEQCCYVSLSPIYDSISKQGYKSAFTMEELHKAADRGIIDRRVMALGGVIFDKVDEVMSLGFGGAMILGDAWR